MQPKNVEQFRAELTLPHSTISITSNDSTQVQLQVKVACSAENLKPTFDGNSGENTVFILDDSKHRIGQIASYEVDQSLSVSHLVESRKQAQKAA